VGKKEENKVKPSKMWMRKNIKNQGEYLVFTHAYFLPQKQEYCY